MNYYGNDTENYVLAKCSGSNELIHWKYIKRYKKNGKWRYVYPNKSNDGEKYGTSSEDTIVKKADGEYDRTRTRFENNTLFIEKVDYNFIKRNTTIIKKGKSWLDKEYSYDNNYSHSEELGDFTSIENKKLNYSRYSGKGRTGLGTLENHYTADVVREKTTVKELGYKTQIKNLAKDTIKAGKDWIDSKISNYKKSKIKVKYEEAVLE